MAQQTYYDILGISQNAGIEIIHAAYQALNQKYQTAPNATEQLIQIRQAYAVLSDPIKRAEYDSWLRMSSQFGQSAPPPFGTHPATTPPIGTAGYRTQSPKAKGSSAAAWVIGILAALIAVAVLAYVLVSSSGFFGDQDEPVTPLEQAPSQATQAPELHPIEPIAPPTPTATPQQQAARDQAHAAYLAAVGRINAVWTSLPKTTQDSLRDEQRSINNAREQTCKAQAASQYSYPLDIEAARYHCEVPMLDERTQTLRVYAASIASQPTIVREPIYVPTPVYVDSDDPVSHTTPSEARALYDDAVANINAVWNSLPDEMRQILRDEQRAVNADRERRCKTYAQSVYQSRSDQTVARYLCEVPELDERAAELSQYY